MWEILRSFFCPIRQIQTTQIRPTPLNFTIFWLPQPIKKKLIKKKNKHENWMEKEEEDTAK
jgi:hypothetical protein